MPRVIPPFPGTCCHSEAAILDGSFRCCRQVSRSLRHYDGLMKRNIPRVSTMLEETGENRILHSETLRMDIFMSYGRCWAASFVGLLAVRQNILYGLRNSRQFDL